MFCTVGPHGDQRVLDLAEGPLHGLFVGEQRLFGAGLLGFDAAPVAAGIEQGLDNAQACAPEIGAAVGQRGQVIALEAERTRQ